MLCSPFFNLFSSACSVFLCFVRKTPKHFVCEVSGPFVLCDTSHWLWGPRCSATHASHSVCVGSHVLFVLGQHFRIVIIMRLGISATIAIDPLFEIIRPKVAINSCTSSVPSPTTMGADPASACLSPGPFWFHPKWVRPDGTSRSCSRPGSVR